MLMDLSEAPRILSWCVTPLGTVLGCMATQGSRCSHVEGMLNDRRDLYTQVVPRFWMQRKMLPRVSGSFSLPSGLALSTGTGVLGLVESSIACMGMPMLLDRFFAQLSPQISLTAGAA